jgi:hypothetical protein
VAPTKRCAGELPSWITPFIPGAKNANCDGFRVRLPFPDAVAPGGALIESVRPVVRKVVGVTGSCTYCLRDPLPSAKLRKESISERESTERGTISESDVKSKCDM